MLLVNQRLQGVLILLTAVSVLSQAEDDSIEFHFENNEGSTIYRSSCHNFTAARQLYEVTISAFNKTEGFMRCFCSLRSTYDTPNVTVRVVSGNKNTEYLLEDNSTLGFKLSFSDAITNGYLYFQGSEVTSFSPDGVLIIADGGVLDFSCSNTQYPQFALPQLNIPSSTLSSLASTQENDCKWQQAAHEHSHNAFYAAIGILGIITTLLLGVVAMLCIFGRRKLVLLQSRLKEMSPSNGSGVFTQSRAALVGENCTEQPKRKSHTPYEDVSSIGMNYRDATFSTAPVQGMLPSMSKQLNSAEDDVLKGKINVKKKPTRHAESSSQAVSSSDVRLYEPLDVYANAEEEPPQSKIAEYAQLNRTNQFS